MPSDINNPDFAKIKEHLLGAPDTSIDAQLKPLIEKWSEPPTSLQLLEVIDRAIFSSLTSGSVLYFIQTLLDDALISEGKKLEDIVPQATWRNGI